MKQLKRSLFTDSRNSWNVVGSIPHQSLKIDNLQWAQAVFLFNFLRSVRLYLANTLAGQRYLHLVTDHLKHILITRNNKHFTSGFLTLLTERTDDIIRFISRQFKPGDSEALKQFAHKWKLFRQLRRRFVTSPLVVLVPLMAERDLTGIKCNKHMSRLFLLY
ncbi:hypothetical protein D3C78_1010070 [compost metagenome]